MKKLLSIILPLLIFVKIICCLDISKIKINHIRHQSFFIIEISNIERVMENNLYRQKLEPHLQIIRLFIIPSLEKNDFEC